MVFTSLIANEHSSSISRKAHVVLHMLPAPNKVMWCRTAIYFNAGIRAAAVVKVVAAVLVAIRGSAITSHLTVSHLEFSNLSFS